MAKTADVLTNMWVDKDRCLANIHSQKGLVMAEKVMIELVDHGVWDEAHEVLKEARSPPWQTMRNSSMSAVAHRPFLLLFPPRNSKRCLTRWICVGVAGEIVDECVALARAVQ